MKIMIKKESNKKSGKMAALLLGVIIWYIVANVLTGTLNFPKSIIYVGDLLNAFVFVNALYAFGKRGWKIRRNWALLCILIFSIIAIFSAIINGESILLLLWGVRNNFRFFAFYFSCLMFIKEREIDILLRIIKYIFWLSLPLCVIEALFVSYPSDAIVGDYVGGVYYGIQGVNAPLNVILIIYVTNVMVKYYEGKCKTSYMLLTLGAALGMAALAEMKIFLVEVVIIMLIATFQKGLSIRGLLLTIIGIFALSFTMQLFVQLNGQGREYYTTDYLSMQGIIDNAFRSSGYDGVGDLNRFTAIPELIDRFYKNDFAGSLIGLGLGNADYSLSFEFLQSQFYKQYSWLHYQWFSSSFVFIETGILGLISYFSIFIASFIEGTKKLKENLFYNRFYQILIVMIILLIFYNPTLRNEQCAYILYMLLAIPFVVNKKGEATDKSNIGTIRN